MSKKNNTEPLSEDEILLFRNAIKKIQPVKKDKVLLKKPVTPYKKRIEIDDKQEPQIYLSDQNIEKILSPDQSVFFARTGLSPRQIKKLKQGKIPVVATLDLHGFDAESAKEELIRFLDFAYKKNKRCITIIHGKGHTDKPVLKNKINSWLRQFDTVLAFTTAQPKHGGTGAVYVLLRATHTN